MQHRPLGAVFSFVAVDAHVHFWQKLANYAKLLIKEFRHGYHEHFTARQDEGLC